MRSAEGVDRRPANIDVDEANRLPIMPTAADGSPVRWALTAGDSPQWEGKLEDVSDAIAQQAAVE